MRIQVSLTPTESKKLIAKAVRQMDPIGKALKDGIIFVKKGTTNFFIIEEMTGRRITKNFCCGINIPRGTCISKDSYLWIAANPGKSILHWVLRRGKLYEETGESALEEMDCDDVYISGANALDINGNAAMIVVTPPPHPTIGRHIPIVTSKGINHVIPVGLEKLIPTPIDQVIKEAVISKISYAMGQRYGLVPLPGQIVTEVEAIKILTGATAIPIAAGGVIGAEGAIHLLIKGNKQQVKNFWMILKTVKRSKLPELRVPDCKTCKSQPGLKFEYRWRCCFHPHE